MDDSLFSKTLVAIDGSEHSMHALEHAAKETKHVDGELIILSVVPKVYIPTFDTPGSGTVSPYIRSYKEQIHDEHMHFLKVAEYNVRENYPSLNVTPILLEGRQAQLIVEEAEKRNVSIIVMGSRGIHGVEGWVLGSTSRRVVEDCQKPILIIK